MIKTKTLFILGAGASAPFGFPTSTQLRQAILARGCDSWIVDALHVNKDYSSEAYLKVHNKFLEEFSKSAFGSIDTFLEHRIEFMDIGKINIAAHLIIHEDDTRLRQAAGNWYMYLYDRLKTSFEHIDQNKISFITFNYDRSLEQFMFEAIRYGFGKSINECTDKLNNIPIVHLYGQLDPLPWQDQNGREYSQRKDVIKRLRSAPNNIKLISDERDIAKSNEFQKAYSIIKDAERIYFLGFSFDETNLERLSINLMKSKGVISTAIGLEPAKLRWVKRHFRDKYQVELFLHSDKDALSLLQNDLNIE